MAHLVYKSLFKLIYKKKLLKKFSSSAEEHLAVAYFKTDNYCLLFMTLSVAHHFIAGFVALQCKVSLCFRKL